MLLGKFYDSLEIHRREKIILAKFLTPHRVVSTCRAAGGLSDRMDYLYNHQVCEPTNHTSGLPRSAMDDPLAYRKLICGRHDLPADKCVTCGTAANMNHAAIVSETFRDLEVIAVCTGGVETNAGRVGDPASVYEGPDGFVSLNRKGGSPGDEADPTDRGTIVTMVFINQELTPGAMVRSVMTATEAKTAALQELSVPSRYSTGLATGTGTDQIAIAARLGSARPLTCAGKHCTVGELIGRTVKKAIQQTLAAQNGLTPAGQGSVLALLDRLGADRATMIRGVGAHLDRAGQDLLFDNFDCLDRDPVTVAATAALVHLRDQLAWGVIAPEVRGEVLVSFAAQLGAAVSGKVELIPGSGIDSTKSIPVGPSPAQPTKISSTWFTGPWAWASAVNGPGRTRPIERPGFDRRLITSMITPSRPRRRLRCPGRLIPICPWFPDRSATSPG